MPDDLARWLAEARRLLEQAYSGPFPGAVRVIVASGDGPSRRRLLFEVPVAAVGPGPVPALSPLEARIVDAVRVSPHGTMTAKQIAAAVKHPPDGRFRFLVQNLTLREPPVLTATPQGYRLA
jgi:hypothetical protein